MPHRQTPCAAAPLRRCSCLQSCTSDRGPNANTHWATRDQCIAQPHISKDIRRWDCCPDLLVLWECTDSTVPRGGPDPDSRRGPGWQRTVSGRVGRRRAMTDGILLEEPITARYNCQQLIRELRGRSRLPRKLATHGPSTVYFLPYSNSPGTGGPGTHLRSVECVMAL